MKITQARVHSDVDLTGLSIYNFYDIDILLGIEMWNQTQIPTFRNLFKNIYCLLYWVIFKGRYYFFQSLARIH